VTKARERGDSGLLRKFRRDLSQAAASCSCTRWSEDLMTLDRGSRHSRIIALKDRVVSAVGLATIESFILSI